MSKPSEISPQPSCEPDSIPLNRGETPLAEHHRLLKDRYQIVESLSRGNFGETFLARDTDCPSQPLCVVKRFSPLQISDEVALAGARQRFTQEAAILEVLGRQHSQIPQLLAHFEVEDEFYLVQELIQGLTLQALLNEAPQRSVDFAIQLLAEILEILTFVHSQGIIHRDIKPDNILHRQLDQRWVLIDFGAFKQLANTPPLLEFGPNTMAIYSEGYTPSEQTEGHPCLASDLYALGMVTLQCLTGQHPNTFRANLRNDGLDWLTKVVGCPDLSAILDTMTRTHWQERYPSAQDALTALRRLILQPQLVNSNITSNARLTTPKATNSHSDIAGSKNYTPTQIYLPAPPPEPPKITIPTNLLVPVPLPPEKATRPYSPEPMAEESGVESTPNSTSESGIKHWPKLALAIAQGYVWDWCKDHNIYRLQDAIAFVVCVGVLLGVATTMMWWVAAMVSLPRQRVATLTQSAKAELLITTLDSGEAIRNLAFSADNTLLFSTDAAGSITAWNVDSHQPIQQMKGFGSLTSLALSSDGRYLASGDEYANINLWNLQNSKLLHTLRDHQLPILSLVFSPDGKTLFTAAEDKQLMRWQLDTGEPKPHTLEISVPITAMAITPDGQYLIGGGSDFALRILNAHTNDLIHILTGHSGAIKAVSVSPNGALLASGSADQTIKLWNLYTGELINTLTGQYGSINTIKFSPDGQILASGSEDGTIWVWHPYSGKILQKLNNFQGSISDLDVSSDSQLLASSTANGQISLWQISQFKTP